jgi:hypothetical protein
MFDECPHGYDLEQLHRCAFCKREIPTEARQIRTLGAADWEREAKRLIWTLARNGDRFTTEDITDKIGFPDQTHRPNGRNNRVGALISSVARDYRLAQVDERKARNPQSNGRTIKVWQGREHRK